jgi:hypothetical protein
MKQLFRVLFLSAFIGGIFLSSLAQVPPPTNLTATQYTGPMAVIAVNLTWQAPIIPTPMMFKFNIYRKDGGLNEPGNFVKKYSNVQMTQFVDAQIQLGNTYSYYVTTVAPNGESVPSNKVQITVMNNLQRGIIAGVLTKDVTNEPIAGGKIYFSPVSPNVLPPSNTGFMFTTDNLGRFKAILPPATYIMKSSANGFVTEYFDNVLTIQQATPIVLNNQDSIFISVGLAPLVPTPPAIIAGLLFADANNNPIRNGKIQFIPTLGPMPSINYLAITDSFGRFRKSLPAASYYVRSEAMGYIPEYYNNVPSIQQATPVVVASGDSVFLNIGLAAFVPPTIYALSGNVTDSLGNPLRAFITVYGLRLNSHFKNNYRVKTDSIGNYSLPVKEGDTVVVHCDPQNMDFFPEFYNNKRTFAEADRVYISGNITGINFVLEHKTIFANGISGRVADSLGTGVESHVTAFPRFTTPTPIITHRKFYTTRADSFGNYLLTNIFPGQYILLANPKMGYRPTYFRYDGTQTMNRKLADSVVVEAAGVVPNINFTVKAIAWNGFAEVAGIVKDISGNKINGAYVLILDQEQQIYSYAISDQHGKFNITGVAPGLYNVVSEKMGYSSNQSFEITVDYLNNISTNVMFILTPEGVTSVGDNKIEIKDFTLYQNYPNPFNPSTTIKYSVPEKTSVKLSVYNILGSEVVNLVNETKNAGEYEITFDASKFSSGVYLYKIEAGNFKATKKFILMK